MIYAKTNPTPYHHNRYNPCFEYMFVLSKDKPKTFNPIKEKTKSLNKRVGTFRAINGELKKANTQEPQEEKILDNIFYYTVGTDNEASEHPAKFPEQLANDHILSWSNVGDTVLDIFMGSGTTAKMAMFQNRNYIGFEISKEYCELAYKRIEQNINLFTNT